MPRSLLLAALALGLIASGCREAEQTPPGAASSGSGSGSGGAGGSGAGGSGGQGGDPLKVVDWNTRNFFNDVDDSIADGEVVLTPAQYQAKREAVAAVITMLDPDVAVLQEIESLGVLDDLNELDLAAAYPYRALIESSDPRGIDIGAISKLPFDDVVSHKDDTFTKTGTNGPIYQFARDCVELHLSYSGRHVVLLGVHFRSKGPPDDPDKRLAEAQHTRAIADAIAAADPTAAISVLGDFNDLPGSPPYQAIAGSGDTAFDDVANLVPSGDRWTFNFNGSLELVDHQMANPVLRSMVDGASVQIPHGSEVDAAGDHAPIAATYRVTAP